MVLGVVYLVMVGITRGEVVYHSPVKNVIHVYSTDGHASLTEVDFLGQSGYPVSIPKRPLRASLCGCLATTPIFRKSTYHATAVKRNPNVGFMDIRRRRDRHFLCP